MKRLPEYCFERFVVRLYVYMSSICVLVKLFEGPHYCQKLLFDGRVACFCISSCTACICYGLTILQQCSTKSIHRGIALDSEVFVAVIIPQVWRVGDELFDLVKCLLLSVAPHERHVFAFESI